MVLVECRVYGPQCAYVYFVDVYDMYRCGRVHIFCLFSTFVQFLPSGVSVLLKVTKTDAGDFNMHFLLSFYVFF